MALCLFDPPAFQKLRHAQRSVGATSVERRLQYARQCHQQAAEGIERKDYVACLSIGGGQPQTNIFAARHHGPFRQLPSVNGIVSPLGHSLLRLSRLANCFATAQTRRRYLPLARKMLPLDYPVWRKIEAQWQPISRMQPRAAPERRP